MPLAVRHRDDPAPPLAPMEGLSVRREDDPAVMAGLQGRAVEEIVDRMAGGHRAWVAAVAGEEAGWGWVATRRARIGELDLTFEVPNGERYLWNFATLPAHRGRGIYPRLLDEIIRAESVEASRFWIIWAPENRASGAGAARAGFVPVAELSFQRDGRPATAGPGGERAARLLAVARTRGSLAPCWRCARAGRPWVMFCGAGACACDYQRPHVGCEA